MRSSLAPFVKIFNEISFDPDSFVEEHCPETESFPSFDIADFA